MLCCASGTCRVSLLKCLSRNRALHASYRKTFCVSGSMLQEDKNVQKHARRLQELSNDPLNILRPSTKLQHSLNLASAYCSPPEHHENENRRGRRHDAKPHEPKVRPHCLGRPQTTWAAQNAHTETATCNLLDSDPVHADSCSARRGCHNSLLAAHLLRELALPDGQAACVFPVRSSSYIRMKGIVPYST